mgnify:FL=1
MKSAKTLAVCGAVAALLSLQASAYAVGISVDEKLAQGDVDASQLSGTVDMTLSGNTLTITLVNTSSDAAGSGAGILLTGVGFNLPEYVSIIEGEVVIAGGSSGVGFDGPSGMDVSMEWGYDDQGLNSGALQGAAGSINTAVSSMESQTTDQFAPGSLVNPPNLDGPDMGLVSQYENDSLGNGVEGIQDSVIITLQLASSQSLDGLLDGIEDGWVALTFGSPDGGTSVPDASTTLSLLAFALMGVEGVRRKWNRR